MVRGDLLFFDGKPGEKSHLAIHQGCWLLYYCPSDIVFSILQFGALRELGQVLLLAAAPIAVRNLCSLV